MFSVLIVDDEPWALQGIKHSFKWDMRGFEVIAETTNPAEARSFISERKPDVVITDINMEEITGIDLMKHAREEKLDSVFVVISGYDDFTYAQAAVNLNAFSYLLKPIDMQEADDILKQLHEHLTEKKRILRKLTDAEVLDNILFYNRASKASPTNNEVNNDSFRNLISYVNKNYSSSLQLNLLSKKFYISPTYICDLFKKVTGKTFTAYVEDLRIEKACELMKNTDMSITEIAEAVGYNTYSYFYRRFKSLYSVTPSQYQEGLRRSKTKGENGD